MTSCGSRLGSGCGPTKALAQKACYVDVAVHLEARDPNLWETYVEEEKTGRDLRTTPPVHFSISEALEDEIYELCTRMKKSTLYENALKLRDSPPQIIPGAKMPFRRSPELPSFEEKDRILKERREKYLTDPTMKSSRSPHYYSHSGAIGPHSGQRRDDMHVCHRSRKNHSNPSAHSG